MSKVKILVENTAFQTLVVAEHGLSMLIENDYGEKLIFDVGQSDSIIHNMSVYKQDFQSINTIVLSHGHYDHSGGLPYLLSQNARSMVYAKRECILDKRRADGSYIGVPQKLSDDLERFVFITEPKEVIRDVFVMPTIKIVHNDDTHFRNMRIWKGGGLVEDCFEDELFLVMRVGESLCVLTGCAHRGISNIIESAISYFKAPVCTVIGGFHTIRESEEKIVRLSERLNEYNIQNIYTCHCTGIEQYLKLKSLCHARVSYVSCGDDICIK